jgi:hypothetical protein
MGERPTAFSIKHGHQSVTLNRGRTYMVYEKRMERSGRIARRLSDLGSQVLTVTRLHPDLVKERIAMTPGDSIWLCERAGQRNVSPNQLNRLFQKASEFLSDNPDGTIIFEGIEYLLLYNELKKVLTVLERINDLIMSSNATMVLSIDPPTLEPRTLAYLRRSAEVIG